MLDLEELVILHSIHQSAIKLTTREEYHERKEKANTEISSAFFFLIDHYKGTTNSENNDSHYLQAVAPTTEMFEDGNLIIF